MEKTDITDVNLKSTSAASKNKNRKAMTNPPPDIVLEALDNFKRDATYGIDDIDLAERAIAIHKANMRITDAAAKVAGRWIAGGLGGGDESLLNDLAKRVLEQDALLEDK